MFNEYIEWYEDEEGLELPRKIRVSNTYPLLRKLIEDSVERVPIPYDVKRKEANESFQDYIKRLIYELIQENKKIYQELSGKFQYHTILKKYVDSNIEEILYKGFRLLFLKSDTDLLLLNYRPKRVNFGFLLNESLIADFKRNRNYHINELKFQSKTYKIINTYDAFMPYAEINGQPADLGLNVPFFGSFKRSLLKQGIDRNHTKGSCQEYDVDCDPDIQYPTGCVYHYYILDNVIIINRYEKTNDDKFLDITELF